MGYIYGHVFPVNLLHAVPGEGRGIWDLMEPRGLTLVAKEMRGTQEPGHRTMVYRILGIAKQRRYRSRHPGHVSESHPRISTWRIGYQGLSRTKSLAQQT